MVTSVPKVCGLEVIPSVVRQYGFVRFRYCLSDLEGDVNLLCLGLGTPGSTPAIDCEALSPPWSTINRCVETDPIQVTLPVGYWALAMNFSDSAANLSNTEIAYFFVQ